MEDAGRRRIAGYGGSDPSSDAAGGSSEWPVAGSGKSPEAGPVDDSGGWRLVAPTDAARSPLPTTCPYFRSLRPGATLAPPVEAPDPVNRCTAGDEIKPQSYRQQELVCLTSGHVNCPRYLRATARVRRRPMARRVVVRGIGRATGAATVLLAASLVVAVGYLVAGGGLSLPSRSASPTVAGVASPSSPAVLPTTGARESPVAPSSSPSAIASASPSPTVAPSPTRRPERTPRPTPPRSDRYNLLDPCPDRPRCWIYTIRAGDNLFSIANYFGVPLERVYELNPWTREQGLRAGQELILPPPTR